MPALARALTVVFALMLWPSFALADDWTPQDTADEKYSDLDFSLNQFDRAEATSRAVLARHPDSVSALIYHIKDLEALDRTGEALAEARHAYDLSPTDATAAEWLGLALVRTGKGDDAIPYLLVSIALNPKEESASFWLARAYEQAGQNDDAKKQIDALLANKTNAQKGATEWAFADTYRQTGDKASAVMWWKRAAALGNPNAAEWLSWAYGNGYGVPPDSGDSAYWARRTATPSYAWFPSLPFADKVDAAANGWGLVLIAVAAAIILPAFTINLVAFACSGGLTTDPFIHWSERARIAYPFQTLLAGVAILTPAMHVVADSNFPSELLPLPKPAFLIVIYLVALLTCNALATHWSRRYRADTGTWWQNLKDLGVTLYLYLSTIFLMFLVASFLPTQWNAQAALLLAAIVLLVVWMNSGGWIRLGRLLGVFRPADAELRALVAGLARRIGQAVPTSYLVNWRKANAYAVPLSNAVCITRKAREILNPAETEAVLAHEMAHISESRSVRTVRMIIPLFMFMPIFTFDYWDGGGSPWGLLVFFAAPIAGIIIHQRLARQMEVRADAFAHQAESSPGVYPSALAKLYEANLTPAVMSGQRKAHPHLYDRMLAAGITPDFPRPQPPKRWALWAILAVVVINLICLNALWFALF